jgi:uncharacterized protein YcbK (DUF882 family)
VTPCLDRHPVAGQAALVNDRMSLHMDAMPTQNALPGPARRRFLKRLGACCGVLGSIATTPVLANVSGSRSVSFIHTHTGERLTTQYFSGGSYRPDALSQVNHLLRDFRTGEVFPIDPALLDILFNLQLMADRNDAFEVISGYRSAATNAMLRRGSDGVAQHSLHMEGRAIDVRLQGFATRGLSELARSWGRGGVGFYPASDFVHVDTGRVRFW